MKVAFIICIVLAVTAGSPAKRSEFPRRYDPSEEDMYRTKYLLMEDGDGRYRLEDLTIQPDQTTKASAADVTFYLYTKNNPESPKTIPGTDFGALSGSNFQSTKKNVFIAHGWNNNYLSAVNTNIRSAIINNADINVFVVDWSGPANKFYTTAKDAVPDIGVVVADFVNYIISTYGVSISNFHLVGHSLGAHVVGCAGAALNGKVPTIVGLDPAGPLYTVGNTNNRIDVSDAQFVHIIHTNSILGFTSAIGHADYYPNGGKNQVGCGIDLAGTCAHSRAYLYYAESISSGIFTARNCASHSDFENGKCDGSVSSRMGELNVDKKADGDYYLATNSDAPFALG